MKIGSGTFDWPGASVVVMDEDPNIVALNREAYEAMRRSYLAAIEADFDRQMAKEDLIRAMREVMDQCTKAAEGKS